MNNGLMLLRYTACHAFNGIRHYWYMAMSRAWVFLPHHQNTSTCMNLIVRQTMSIAFMHHSPFAFIKVVLLIKFDKAEKERKKSNSRKLCEL